MSIIVPAVLVRDEEECKRTLDRLSHVRGIREVQIDVVDGRFARPASWPYASGKEAFMARAAAHAFLPHAEDFVFEADLMVERPDEMIGAWLSVGVTRLAVHVESTMQLSRLIADLQVLYGHEKAFAPDLLSLGLAIGIQTDPSILEPYLAHADYVQFMGIAEIGKQGQPFDNRVLARVRAFKRMHPDVPVQVDGGVTLETAPLLLAAGVDRLVVGHALTEAPHMQAAFDAFIALTQTHGIFN